jgi:Icc-related predicted phosphoesterase
VAKSPENETSVLENKLLHKRYVDIMITHAPPFGIHDQSDRCHRGFKSFRTIIENTPPGISFTDMSIVTA